MVRDPFDPNLLPESVSYKRFKEAEAELQKLNFFEKCCKFSSRFLKVKAPTFLKKKWDDAIYMADLKITSGEIFSLLILSFVFSFFILIPFVFFLEFPTNILLLFGLPAFVAYNVITYPMLYSDIVRIKAGNETVDIILYMVIYLSLNPVYEKAVEFSAMNCHGPLGRDFKKIMWDVEMGNYTTVKEALGYYSKKWTIWNEEFVTSLITLQMIGLQTSQEKRREIMDEALERTLRSTYKKMKNYALSLKIPSTMLLSFGIVLPLMGLIMFPLISIFLTESVNPIYIAVGYIIILPSLIWWYLDRLISRRPSAFSHSEKSGGVRPNEYFEIKKLNLKMPIKMTAILITIILILPGIFYLAMLYFDYDYYHAHYAPHEAKDKWKEYCLSRYGPDVILYDVFQAMFIVWGVAAGIIFYTYFRSKDKYELEEYIRKIEQEFEVGLFELEGTMTQNIPIEVAIPQILDKYERMNKKNSPMYEFFSKINTYITQLSMTFKDALFNEKMGILKDYPSQLIKNIMNIIVSSISKSPAIVSNAAKNIVTSLRRIREIESLIKDLLEDIISSLKTQTTFMAPLIGGIVASIGVLIVQLLQSISIALTKVEKMFSFGSNIGESTFSSLSLIKLEEVMPPTIMELIVGVYLIESVIIMSIFLIGVQRGFDEVSRDYTIARNLSIAVVFFTIIFFLMIMIFQPIITKVTSVA